MVNLGSRCISGKQDLLTLLIGNITTNVKSWMFKLFKSRSSAVLRKKQRDCVGRSALENIYIYMYKFCTKWSLEKRVGGGGGGGAGDYGVRYRLWMGGSVLNFVISFTLSTWQVSMLDLFLSLYPTKFNFHYPCMVSCIVTWPCNHQPHAFSVLGANPCEYDPINFTSIASIEIVRLRFIWTRY